MCETERSKSTCWNSNYNILAWEHPSGSMCIRGSRTLGQSGCGRICAPDPSSSANLDSQIWVAASTSPYFWTNSARVNQHLAPRFRCLVVSDSRRYKLLSFHCPWQLVHSSRRRASFSELRCAALPAAWISRGVLEPEAFIRGVWYD